LRAVTACAALKAGLRRLRVFQVIGSLTGVLLLLTAVLTRQLQAANGLIFIAFEAVWTAIICVVCARGQAFGEKETELKHDK
jgi:hypothetical protein